MSVTLGLSAVSSVVFCFLSCPLVALVVPSLSPSLLELLASSKRFTCAIHQIINDACFLGKHRRITTEIFTAISQIEGFRGSCWTISALGCEKLSIPQGNKPGSCMKKFRRPTTSVADPGCLIRIPEPDSSNPGSRIQVQKDSGSASKNLSIFNPKNCF